MRRWLPLAMGVCLNVQAAPDPGPDSVPSVMWAYHHQRILEGAPFVFDSRVVLQAPPFAEDARQVPIQVDARGLPGPVRRLVAWAELNPIPRIFDFRPGERVLPVVAVRIRVEQATAVRVAALTDDGVWHVGSAWVDAAGGGCTAPSVVRAQPGWEQRLGHIQGARFAHDGASRLRLRIDHPMDNGLVGGVPEFFLNQAELRTPTGEVLASLELFPAVAENPTLSLETRTPEPTHLWLRDNNGNEFEADF